MTIQPIHHLPLRPEFKSPFSAAFAIEAERLVFFSGCACVPPYHVHPHDPVEEAQWLKGDFREQTDLTFKHIGEILVAAGLTFANVIKLNIFVTDMDGQNILNEISARHFDPTKPPARTLVGVPTLAHPNMMIEIEGVAAGAAK